MRRFHRREGFRGIGGSAAVSGVTPSMVSGFSDSNYYQGNVSEGMPSIASVRLVFKLIGVPTSGQKQIANRIDNTGTNGGWAIATSVTGTGDLTVVQRVAGGSRNSFGWIPTSDDVGQVFVLHGVIDAGNILHSYINGVEISTGVAMGAAPAPARSADVMTIGRYQYATGLSNPFVGIISLCGSSTGIMTSAQIFADASTILGNGARVFPAMPSEEMRYVASDLPSATWTDQDNHIALARTGSPTVGAPPALLSFTSPLGQTWSDSGPVVTGAQFDIPTEYASLRVSTDADVLFLGVGADNTDYGSTGLPFVSAGVSINGATPIPVGPGGHCVALGTAGTTRTIDLTAGIQLVTVPNNQGVWIERIGVPAGRTLSFLGKATTTARLGLINDSIMCGYFVTQPQTQSEHMLLRAAWPGRTAAIGAGGYSLWNLYGNVASRKFASRAAFVSAVATMMDGSISNTLLLQIGTNDYGQDGQQWTLATYTTEVSTLWSALRAAMPSCTFFYQTICDRTDSSPNIHGYTIAQWRTAQTDGLTASGVSATVIAGATLTGALSPDGVHKTTAGAAADATTIRTAMGF